MRERFAVTGVSFLPSQLDRLDVEISKRPGRTTRSALIRELIDERYPPKRGRQRGRGAA